MTKTSKKLSVELIKIIREVIGPIAAFRLVARVEALPRTRSGKIQVNNVKIVFHQCFFWLGKTMRKSMSDFARNKRVILPATIEDATVFTDIRRALQELGYAMTAPDPVLSVRKM